MPRTDYSTRAATRLARMREAAARKRDAAQDAYAAGQAIAQQIPMGQPILVGHHSEKRHRRALKRIDASFRKSMEAVTEAAELERRIAAAETSTAISADDPNAVERYREKAADLERSLAAMKAANKWIRACKLLTDQQMSVELAAEGHDMPAHALMRARQPPFGAPGFSTTNTAAELRRVRKRIAELEAEAQRAPAEPISIARARLEECPEDNRMRIRFPGRLTEQEAALMRRAGFVWSPTAEAWQRKLNDNARRSARFVAEQIAALDQTQEGPIISSDRA